jgi:hypothetical protein
MEGLKPCNHTRNPIRLEPQNQIPGTDIDFWLWCGDCGSIKPHGLEWVRPLRDSYGSQTSITTSCCK